MGRIKITISVDRHGWMYVDPKSARVERQIRARLAEMGRPAHGKESLLFIQHDSDKEAFLADLPKSAARAVREGWDVTCLFDSWSFGQLCGCDW
jgi:hypothetical protein